MTIEDKNYYRESIDKLYYYYLDAIEKKDKNNIIYKIFLDNQDVFYLKNTHPKRMVLDFIAGMTDTLFLSQINSIK